MAVVGPPVWASGVWADTVWASGVWNTAAVGGGGAAPGDFVGSQQTQWAIPTRVNAGWAEPIQVGAFTVTAK